ncbi:MAG: alpha/beta hydrolase [Alphaproteobacteria bacterium]|nr:alpha/beta hydrolase [Alphaproteobacteria bacterium]
MSDPITIALDDDKIISAFHGQPREDAVLKRKQTLVLMMHGFPGDKSSHNNIYGELEFILNHKGFHTLRFDFYGCGKSSGSEEDFSLNRARVTLDIVKEWAESSGYKRLIFISEGLGCAVALMNMEINLACQVMLWPALDAQHVAKTLFGADNISLEAKQNGYVSLGDHKAGLGFISELSKTNLKPLFQDTTMPVLIMHGVDDNLYPVEQLDLARQYMTSKRIEIMTFQDGAHGLPALNHRKSMFFHITQFIEKYA